MEIGTHPESRGGIGGIGFMLQEVATKCEWSQAQADAVIYSVPTIDRPEYYPCSDVSSTFATCLYSSADTCVAIVPPECEDARAAVDACW
jgi:hypothetical protein